VSIGEYAAQKTGETMNVYEVTLHGTDSIYLLAPTKYRRLELVGDYPADAGRPETLESGDFVVRSICPKNRYFAPKDARLVLSMSRASSPMA